MIIPPKKFVEPNLGKKRDFQTYAAEQRGALGEQKVKDVLLAEDRRTTLQKNDGVTSSKLSGPSTTKKLKKNVINLGPSNNHFGSLEDLQRAHGKDYFPHGKPLVFLKNKDNSVFVHARTYVTGWTAESNAELIRSGPRPRSIELIAGLIHPKTLLAVELGPVSVRTIKDEKSLIFSLLMFPGGANENFDTEEELLLLAQCMYCFDVGQHVSSDVNIARAMQKGLDASDIDHGVNLAMHHAAAYGDTKQALYFLNKGGDPREIWDGNHQDAFEEALARNNSELISAFLEKMSKKDIGYLQDLIRPGQFRQPEMGYLVAAKIVSLFQYPSQEL